MENRGSEVLFNAIAPIYGFFYNSDLAFGMQPYTSALQIRVGRFVEVPERAIKD